MFNIFCNNAQFLEVAYKYFKNKAAIFDAIVGDYHASYRANFIKFISHENRDSFDAQSNAFLAQALFASIKADRVKFVLLMEQSDGTRYAGFRDETVALLETHILKGVAASNKEEYIIKIIVRNFFYGIIEIAKDYQNDEWAYKNISLLVQYHMQGMSLLYQ